MAKHKSFHQRQDQKKVELAPKPSTLLSLLVLVLLGMKVLEVFLAPLRTPVRLVFLAASLWLGIGTLIYGTSYLSYLSRKQEIMAQRMVFQVQENQWKKVLQSHPTSREALLGAYVTSVALGDDDQAANYKALLMRIDPNDPRVKNLQ